MLTQPQLAEKIGHAQEAVSDAIQRYTNVQKQLDAIQQALKMAEQDIICAQSALAALKLVNGDTLQANELSGNVLAALTKPSTLPPQATPRPPVQFQPRVVIPRDPQDSASLTTQEDNPGI